MIGVGGIGRGVLTTQDGDEEGGGYREGGVDMKTIRDEDNKKWGNGEGDVDYLRLRWWGGGGGRLEGSGLLATQGEDNGGGGGGGARSFFFLTAYSLLKNTLVLHVGVGAVLWLVVVFSSHGLCMIMRPSTGLPFTNEAFYSNPESVHSSPESDRIRPVCLWQLWVRHKKQGGYEGNSKRRLWN